MNWTLSGGGSGAKLVVDCIALGSSMERLETLLPLKVALTLEATRRIS